MSSMAETVLMVRPAAFGFNEQTAGNNVFQSKPLLSAEALQTAAVEEFDAFVSALRMQKNKCARNTRYARA